ncbi:MAG TPA: hypothetical protein VFR76_03350 [Verrucomicrobiae bacterium]|nr:hypothetical protein [Verrucomicrobiae bacterium]
MDEIKRRVFTALRACKQFVLPMEQLWKISQEAGPARGLAATWDDCWECGWAEGI